MNVFCDDWLYVIKFPTLFVSFFNYYITSWKYSSLHLTVSSWNSGDALSFRSAVSMAPCHFSVEKGNDDDDDVNELVVDEEEEEEKCISAERSHIPSPHSAAGKELQLCCCHSRAEFIRL